MPSFDPAYCRARAAAELRLAARAASPAEAQARRDIAAHYLKRLRFFTSPKTLESRE